MNTFSKKSALSSLPLLALASCAMAEDGESVAATASASDMTIEQKGEFEKPWAIEFAHGTDMLFVTEKEGVLKVMDTASGTSATVAGAPDVAFGAKAALATLPSFQAKRVTASMAAQSI